MVLPSFGWAEPTSVRDAAEYCLEQTIDLEAVASTSQFGAQITSEGSGALQAKSCAILIEASLDKVDQGELTEVAGNFNLLPLIIKAPGFAFADCFEDRPHRALTVMPNPVVGLRVRAINSPAVGRACVQNYGMN